jgi:outer membrane protein OmpA-like peptidoglycan-associated protein
MNLRRGLAAAIGTVALLTAGQGWAVTSFDSLSFKPANDHGYYLTVEQSQTLGQWGYAAGLYAEFSDDSLIIENAVGSRIQDVIDKQLALQLGAALGLLDWLNAGLTVSFVPYQQFTTPGTVFENNGARMGDILFNLKARLLDNKKYPVGIAVVPFVTFPTGSDDHLVGNGKISGGGLLVLDSKRIKDRVSLALNVGAQIRDDVTLSPGTTLDDQFLYGAAVNVEVAKPVQIIAEIDGWTLFDDFFGSNSRNLEIDGALRFFPGAKRKLAITAGGGTGLQDGAGAPDWRVFAGLTYRNEAEPPVVVPPPMPAPVKEEVITTNRIHFAFNKAVIRPESYPVIDEILASIKGRPEIENVRVEGHTDNVGSDAYNQKLSDQRANAVRQYMIDKGYPSDKVTAVGMGESAPIADNATKAGRAQNRRVEFHLSVRQGSHVTVKKKGEPSPTFEEGDKIKDKK